MTARQPSHMTFGPLPARPLVSVLMPAYNAAPFVLRAVESILAQTYTHWELLLLDDGSTDATASIINQLDDARIKRFANENNEGYLRACNRLFEEATGDLITFLDADDTCTPDRLQRCMQVMESAHDIGFLTTDYERIDMKGRVLSTHQQTIDFERYATDPDYLPLPCCATIFLRKELRDAVGGYHPFFDRMGGEDYHWLFHLAQQAKGVHLAACMYHYTSHPAQTHLRNSNPLKYFVEEIDRQLRTEWLELKQDGLADSVALRRQWERHVADNPHELAFQRAADKLNHGHWNAAFLESLAIIPAAPLRADAWKKFGFLLYSWARRGSATLFAQQRELAH